MVDSFVGGVRDSQGLRGYVEVAPGEVVALNLADGAVIWRRQGIGRPVAATVEKLITVDRAGSEFVLRIFGAGSGADAGRIENLGMPGLAAESGLAPDAVQIASSEDPHGIRLAWRLRRPYRGGAPPPADISSRAQQEATGTVVVDPNAMRVVSTDSAPALESAPPTRPRQTSPDPNVFALDRVGGRLFTLRARTGRPGLTLEARDADGTLLWEVSLDTQAASRPTPQRQ